MIKIVPLLFFYHFGGENSQLTRFQCEKKRCSKIQLLSKKSANLKLAPAEVRYKAYPDIQELISINSLRKSNFYFTLWLFIVLVNLLL